MLKKSYLHCPFFFKKTGFGFNNCFQVKVARQKNRIVSDKGPRSFGNYLMQIEENLDFHRESEKKKNWHDFYVQDLVMTEESLLKSETTHKKNFVLTIFWLCDGKIRLNERGGQSLHSRACTGPLRELSDHSQWVGPFILSSLRNALPDLNWFRSSPWAILIGQNKTPGPDREVGQLLLSAMD